MVPAPFDGAEGDLTRPAEDVPPAVPVGPPGDAASPPASDEEASDEIDAYMAQLLDRINQRSSSQHASGAGASSPPQEAPAGSKSLPAPPTSASEPEVRPAAASDPSAPSAADAADESVAQRKRSLPPERAADMVAMRQLAISSARDAIERYSAKRYNREAGDKLMVAVVLSMMSGLSAWTAHGSHVMLGTAVVGFTASAFCLLRSIQLYGRAREARHRANGSAADT